MKPFLIFLMGLIEFIGIAWAKTAPRFSAVQERAPEKIWSSHLSSKTRSSLLAFQQHRVLSNGVKYGEIVRTLDLRPLCEKEILDWAQKHACTRHNGEILDPANDKPVLDRSNHPVPLISLLCPDGGVIRIKPNGDPVSGARYPREAKPSVVKAMRYFGEENYDSFVDEAFKIDNSGFAVPKSPRDLNTDLTELQSSTADRVRYIDEWAQDAHTPLSESCSEQSPAETR